MSKKLSAFKSKSLTIALSLKSLVNFLRWANGDSSRDLLQEKFVIGLLIPDFCHKSPDSRVGDANALVEGMMPTFYGVIRTR